MTKSAQDFARDMTAIVDASAHALTTLNRVLELQQQNILALATAGGVTAPQAGAAEHARHVEVVASRAGASAAPGPAATAESASHAAMSPEDLLALAQKTAQALLDHAPSVAISSLYQSASHAVGIALMNTTNAQQQLSIIAQAVVTQGAANQLARQRAASISRDKDAAEPAPAALRAQTPGALAR